MSSEQVLNVSLDKAAKPLPSEDKKTKKDEYLLDMPLDEAAKVLRKQDKKSKKDEYLLDMSLDQAAKVLRNEARKARKESSKTKALAKEDKKISFKKISAIKKKDITDNPWKHDKFSSKDSNPNRKTLLTKAVEKAPPVFTKDLRANMKPGPITTAELRARLNSRIKQKQEKRKVVSKIFKEDKREVPVAPAKIPSPPRPAPPKQEISFKSSSGPAIILMSNLDDDACAEDIKSVFSNAGEVIKVELLYNSKNEFTGNAEAVMATIAGAKKVIDTYNGLEIDGHTLSLKLMESSKAKSKINRENAKSQETYRRHNARSPSPHRENRSRSGPVRSNHRYRESNYNKPYSRSFRR